jgi:ketosteroid isomerase-like protein
MPTAMPGSTNCSSAAGLGLITSASAQQVDQNTRQQIERIAAAYVENWNKHDAAGIAALYAKDGVQVTAAGVRSGPQEIEQAYQSAMKTFPQHNGQTIEQISPLGNDADHPNWRISPQRPGGERPYQARRALHCG